MAIEKLDKSELYGFPVTDLETATAEETAGGITLPVIVVSNGVLTYKVVATKTWSDYVATTTADAISAANAKVDAATAKVDAATAKVDAAVQTANTAANNAQSAADNANSKAASLDGAVTKANKLSGDVSAMETRVSGVGTVIDNANNAATSANNAATAADNAAKSAEEVAANPTYVGTDNYVYRYDRTTKAYVKTEVYVKGEKGDTGATGAKGDKGDAGEVTKAAVEAVLTGNITSHTHDQYVTTTDLNTKLSGYVDKESYQYGWNTQQEQISSNSNKIKKNSDNISDLNSNFSTLSSALEDLYGQVAKLPKVVQTTESDYAALTTKDSGTLYCIPE